MVNYIYIFIFKIIEDSLATLRLILVSNGKKVLGAILQFIVTVIWIWLTGYVLIDFMSDMFKVCAFALGSLFGSYIGSLIEEKIALGTNCFIIKSFYLNDIFRCLNINYKCLALSEFIIVVAPRKRTKDIVRKVKSIDKKAYIICEKIKDFSCNHI